MAIDFHNTLSPRRRRRGGLDEFGAAPVIPTFDFASTLLSSPPSQSSLPSQGSQGLFFPKWPPDQFPPFPDIVPSGSPSPLPPTPPPEPPAPSPEPGIALARDASFRDFVRGRLGNATELIQLADQPGSIFGGLTATHLALLAPLYAAWRQGGGGGGGGGGGEGAGGGDGGGGGIIGGIDTHIGGVPITDFGTAQFDDPGTALLEDILQFRLKELFEPVEDPARQQYADELQRLFGSFREPLRNPEVDPLIGRIRSRMSELEGPVFSAEEENLLRTRSLDDITRAQDVAEQRAVEQFGGRGLEATSGVRADVLGDIAREFAGLRSQEAGEFGRFAVGERQRRQERALELGEQVRGLEEGEIQRGETRGIQGLTIAQELAQLAEQIRGEEQQRRREAIANAGLLAELPERRLQLALATLGQQPPPGSLFAQLAQMIQGQQGLNLQGMNLNRLVELQRLQQRQGFFGGLGSILSNLGGLFNTGTQGAGQDFGGG